MRDVACVVPRARPIALHQLVAASAALSSPRLSSCSPAKRRSCGQPIADLHSWSLSELPRPATSREPPTHTRSYSYAERTGERGAVTRSLPSCNNSARLRRWRSPQSDPAIPSSQESSHHISSRCARFADETGTRLVAQPGMSIASTSTPDTAHAVGELVIGGDWACAHGDFETLHFITQQLAGHAQRGLKRQLLACADACYADPDQAAAQWASLRTLCFDPH